MADNHDNNSKPDTSPEDVLKPTKGDAAHRGIKTGLATIPVLGGLAAEVFDSLIVAPASKRRDEFLLSVYAGLKRLEEKFEGFSVEGLAENATFTSTVIQATQAAIRTHQKEKQEALRNAALNSALPNSPEQSFQAIFVQLCDELTDAHIRVLKLFEGTSMPTLNLDDPTWRGGIALDKLVNLIESSYPESRGKFNLHIQIIVDLHLKGLVSNRHPARDMLTRRSSAPELTDFAKEFLAFLKSPLDD